MAQMRILRPFPNLATREPFLTNVFEVYHQMFKMEYCCDTLLISKEDIKFHVHHFILIGCSGFFRNHLIQNSSIRLNLAFKFDISENILRHIVEFMYTGLLDTFFKDEKIDFAVVHNAAVTMGISALAKYCSEIQEGCMTIGPLGDTNKPTTKNTQPAPNYKLPIKKLVTPEERMPRRRGRPRKMIYEGVKKRGRPRKYAGSETGTCADAHDVNSDENVICSNETQSQVHSDSNRTVLSKSVQNTQVCNSVPLEISEEEECRRWIVEQANSEDTFCRLIKMEPESPTEPHAEGSKCDSERSETSGDPCYDMDEDRIAMDSSDVIKEEPEEGGNFLKVVSCESLASNSSYSENETNQQLNESNTEHVIKEDSGDTLLEMNGDTGGDMGVSQTNGEQVKAVAGAVDLRVLNNRLHFWKRGNPPVSKNQMAASQSVSESQLPVCQSVSKSQIPGSQSVPMTQTPSSQSASAVAKISNAGKQQPLSIAPRPAALANVGGVPVSAPFLSCTVRNQPSVPSSTGNTAVSTASLQPRTVVTSTQLPHTVVVPAGHLQPRTILQTNQLQQGTMLPIQLQPGQIVTTSNLQASAIIPSNQLQVGTVIPAPPWQASTPVGATKTLPKSIIAAQLQAVPQVQSPGILQARQLQQGTVAVLQQPNIQLANTRPELLNQSVLNYTVPAKPTVSVAQSQSTVSQTTPHSPIKKMKLTEETSKGRIIISKLSSSISEMSNVIEKVTSADSQDSEADVARTCDKSLLDSSEESQGNVTLSPQPYKEAEKAAKKPTINLAQGMAMRRQRCHVFAPLSSIKPTVVVSKSLLQGQGVCERKLDVVAASAPKCTQSSKGSSPRKHKRKHSFDETGSQGSNIASGEIIEILPRLSQLVATATADNPQTSSLAVPSATSTPTIQYATSATTMNTAAPPVLPGQTGLVFTVNQNGTITPSHSGEVPAPVLIEQDKVRPLAWRCTVCQCRFQKWMHLQCHMAETHNHRLVIGKECCGQLFHSKFHYMLHRQQKEKSTPFITHQRLYVCPKFMCKFTGKSAKAWQEHLMIHFEEADKIFFGKNCCGICGKTMDTFNRTGVRRHSLVHMYDHPCDSSWVNIAFMWCKFCKNYLQGTNATLHLKEVHNVWSTEMTTTSPEDTTNSGDTQRSSRTATPDGTVKDNVSKSTEEKTSEPRTAQVLSKFKLILPKATNS